MKDGGSNPLGVGVERMLSTMSCHRLHDVSCAGHFGLQVNCYPLRTSLFYSTLERMWVFYYPTFFFFFGEWRWDGFWNFDHNFERKYSRRLRGEDGDGNVITKGYREVSGPHQRYPVVTNGGGHPVSLTRQNVHIWNTSGLSLASFVHRAVTYHLSWITTFELAKMPFGRASDDGIWRLVPYMKCNRWRSFSPCNWPYLKLHPLKGAGMGGWEEDITSPIPPLPPPPPPFFISVHPNPHFLSDFLIIVIVISGCVWWLRFKCLMWTRGSVF